MDLRRSFLKPFKKLKHKLAKGNRKRDDRSGSETDQEGRGTDIEGSEASQRNSRLHLGVEDMVESGPSREGGGVDGEEVSQVGPPTSTPPIPHSGEPSSM
jgi:hypothetical protein